MSIMFADDFKGYGGNVNYLLNGLWADINWDKTVAARGTTLQPDPDPQAGGGEVLNISGNLLGARRVFLNGSNATIGVAMRVFLPNLPNNLGILCSMLSADNTIRLSVWVSATGQLFIANNRPTNGLPQFLANTATPVLVANAWSHIEIKFVGGSPGGHIEIRVDSITVLAVDLDAGAATFEQVLLNNIDGTSVSFKDFVVWNAQGAHNNDFLGPVSVVSMWTNSDVDFEWQPSTGATGWNLIDNNPPLDNADYITAAHPAPPPSKFGMTDLPLNISSVKGLITQVRARKADGGDGNIQAGLVSGEDTATGADRPITTAFTYYEDVFEVDPATGGVWSPAAADDAVFQVNRTL